MTKISIGHVAFLGFTVFAIVVGSLSCSVLRIAVRRRKFPLAFVVKLPVTRRAVPFVATALLLLAAGCDAEKPTLSLTGGPPNIPHTLEGREGQCLLCHEQGVAGAPKAPANHIGRTADMCTLCHIPATVSASSHSSEVGATPFPGVIATPLAVVGATPSPVVGSTALPAVGATPLPVGGPPRIPHSLKGREGQCLMCHEQGVAGAPKVPANHAGRTSDVCTGCHQPSASGS